MKKIIETILNVSFFVIQKILIIIACIVATVITILLLPVLFVAKLYEKFQPRNTLWL